MEIYPLVYRCAIVVKPKQQMLDWLNSVEPTDPLSLDEINEDSHVYLIPDLEEAEEVGESIDAYLKAHYEGIFLHELMAWHTDPKAFPKLTYTLFQEWFDVGRHSMVFDMVKGAIKKE